MSLDERARRASRAIQRTVEPVIAPDLDRRNAFVRRSLVYLPIAAVFAALIAGAVVFQTKGSDIRPAQRPPTIGKQVATIPLGHRPSHVVTSPGAVWVASTDEGFVIKVDPATNRVVGSVHVGLLADNLVVENGSAWVTSDPNGVVTEVDTSVKVVRTVRIPGPVSGLAVQGSRIWVATSIGRLLAIDSGSGQIVKDYHPSISINAVTVAGGDIWVGEPQTKNVLRVDPSSGRVINRIPVGRAPETITTVGPAVWVGSVHPAGVVRIQVSSNKTKTVGIPVNASDPIGTAVLSGSEGAMWFVGADVSANWYLLELDAGTGAILYEHLLPEESVGPALEPGALWLAQGGSKNLLRFQLIEH